MALLLPKTVQIEIAYETIINSIWFAEFIRVDDNSCILLNHNRDYRKYDSKMNHFVIKEIPDIPGRIADKLVITYPDGRKETLDILNKQFIFNYNHVM